MIGNNKDNKDGKDATKSATEQGTLYDYKWVCLADNAEGWRELGMPLEASSTMPFAELGRAGWRIIAQPMRLGTQGWVVLCERPLLD